MARKHEGKEVAYYTINKEEHRGRPTSYLKLYVSLPMALLDSRGVVGREYLSRGIPYFVVIDRQGVVRAAHAGYGEDIISGLDQAIQKALAE